MFFWKGDALVKSNMWGLFLLCLLLTGCLPLAAPRPATPPSPLNFREFVLVRDGESATIAPGDAAFDGLAAAWRGLLPQVSGRARTFFSPARFQAEVLPEDRVEVYFDLPYPTVLADRSTQTDHLIFVYVGQDPLILGQYGQEWSAFLTSADVVRSFTTAVEQATDLLLAPRSE
jgi:hypothetical protein